MPSKTPKTPPVKVSWDDDVVRKEVFLAALWRAAREKGFREKLLDPTQARKEVLDTALHLDKYIANRQPIEFNPMPDNLLDTKKQADDLILFHEGVDQKYWHIFMMLPEYEGDKPSALQKIPDNPLEMKWSTYYHCCYEPWRITPKRAAKRRAKRK